MFHVTIFGGHDGQLQPDKRFYLTLFAGCDLVRPTIARRLLAQKQGERNAELRPHRAFFLTIFAGVDIMSPTLVEEFLDLREMMAGGLLDTADWDRCMGALGQPEGSIASLTLFGGLDEHVVPSENEEIDSLATQQHLGNIPESAGQVLQFGIGQKGAERLATVKRALQTTV